jgi:hypothetical protein
MRLYIEGHCLKGYAISRTWSAAECSMLPEPSPEELRPVRFEISRDRAFGLVARWNRRYATHKEVSATAPHGGAG